MVFPSNPPLGVPVPESNPNRDPLSNPPLEEGPHKHKKQRILRPKYLEVFQRLREDFKWSDAMDTAERVLVGRVRGCHYSAARLKQWETEVWSEHLAKPLVVQTFVKGWFALYFARAEHTNWVLSAIWHIEQAPVLLRRWTSLFDPEREQLRANPIWVRLRGFPLQFWSEDISRRIRNALSTYLQYDKSYLLTRKMAYAWILVHIDTIDELQEYITI